MGFCVFSDMYTAIGHTTFNLSMVSRMTKKELDKELDRIDNSAKVECMDNSEFYELAHSLNDRLNERKLYIIDLEKKLEKK